MRLLFLILMSCMLIPCSVSAQKKRPGTLNALVKFDMFIRELNKHYIDTVNNKLLIEAAIRGVLSQLDPHSTYLSAKDMKRFNENFDSKFDGIGVEFSMINDTIFVINTIPGGPAQKAGILPNDRIVAINGVNSVKLPQQEVSKHIRGSKGSVLNLTVYRKGAPELLNFKIVCDKIPVYAINATYKVNDKTGYIRINQFASTTNDELNQALEQLAGIENLILDLRGNPGGALEQAALVCSQFITPGNIIFSTEGLNFKSKSYVSEKGGNFQTGRLCIIVDEKSASASELVAGAIQDWDRGIIIGRPTYGKGLVQRLSALPDGSAVSITIARYHTPSGRVIQRPFELGNKDKYIKDRIDRINNGEKIDSTTIPDSLKYKTLKQGRTVWGGGGIVPDIIIPNDSTLLTKYLVALNKCGANQHFIVQYLDKYRNQLTALYPDEESFIRDFKIDEKEFKMLQEIGEKNNVKFNADEFEISAPFIQVQLKALLGSKLFTQSTYYKIFNNSPFDKEFNAALKSLEL